MMASWHLAPALEDLRGELNELSPRRDKRSDGTIGDAAHQSTSSKHNPNSQGVVRAFDCDKSGPWPTGVDFTDICNHLAERHRDGKDNRLQNIIWNRRIASRSWGWTWRAYSGANAHTEHAHFEVRDVATYWNKRGPWGLQEEFGMPTVDEIADEIMKRFNLKPDGKTAGGRTVAGTLDALASTDAAINPIAKIQIPDYAQPAANRRKVSLATWLGYTDANRNTDKTALLKAIAALDSVDTDALVAALAPALAAAVIAGLPEDRDDITPDELQDAFVGALKILVERPPA